MYITVRIRNNYGLDMIYPACETAIKFAKLTGKKTFSQSDITTIKNLGYEVQVEQVTL